MASVNTSGFHRSFAFSCARKAARFEAARVEADAGGGEDRAELGHGGVAVDATSSSLRFATSSTGTAVA